MADDSSRSVAPDSAVPSGPRHRGRREEAKAAPARAASAPEEQQNLYGLACYHARIGDRAEAIRVLRKHIEAGHIDIWIESYPDLKSLHGEPDIESLVAEMKNRFNAP